MDARAGAAGGGMDGDGGSSGGNIDPMREIIVLAACGANELLPQVRTGSMWGTPKSSPGRLRTTLHEGCTCRAAIKLHSNPLPLPSPRSPFYFRTPICQPTCSPRA